MQASDGVHGALRANGAAPFIIMDPAGLGGAPALLVPLDADLPDRVDAMIRFVRTLQGQSEAPDRRITPARRKRFQNLMRAADRRRAGATYREIAIAIYGEQRVLAEPWKTSSVRASVIGLVNSAQGLIEGGYRRLLRRPRRRSLA